MRQGRDGAKMRGEVGTKSTRQGVIRPERQEVRLVTRYPLRRNKVKGYKIKGNGMRREGNKTRRVEGREVIGCSMR